MRNRVGVALDFACSDSGNHVSGIGYFKSRNEEMKDPLQDLNTVATIVIETKILVPFPLVPVQITMASIRTYP